MLTRNQHRPAPSSVPGQYHEPRDPGLMWGRRLGGSDSEVCLLQWDICCSDDLLLISTLSYSSVPYSGRRQPGLTAEPFIFYLTSRCLSPAGTLPSFIFAQISHQRNPSAARSPGSPQIYDDQLLLPEKSSDKEFQTLCDRTGSADLMWASSSALMPWRDNTRKGRGEEGRGGEGRGGEGRWGEGRGESQPTRPHQACLVCSVWPVNTWRGSYSHTVPRVHLDRDLRHKHQACHRCTGVIG